MIHTTIGIYSNGEWKSNGVKSENLAEHIAYNIRNRFGRALVVDNVLLYKGTVDDPTLSKIMNLTVDHRVAKDTAPYV